MDGKPAREEGYTTYIGSKAAAKKKTIKKKFGKNIVEVSMSDNPKPKRKVYYSFRTKPFASIISYQTFGVNYERGLLFNFKYSIQPCNPFPLPSVLLASDS